MTDSKENTRQNEEIFNEINKELEKKYPDQLSFNTARKREPEGFMLFTLGMNKARQQGIDLLECDECRTTPHNIIGNPTILCKKHYEERRLKLIEQGKKDERERIIEMIETTYGFPLTSKHTKEICISENEWKQFKNMLNVNFEKLKEAK